MHLFSAWAQDGCIQFVHKTRRKRTAVVTSYPPANLLRPNRLSRNHHMRLRERRKYVGSRPTIPGQKRPPFITRIDERTKK